MTKPYKDPNFWTDLSQETQTTQDSVLRHLAKTDLYFLCRYVIGWEFYDHPYAEWFCQKVQDDPWRLWLVARGHMKSLTVTCAHTIQCILNDPEKSTMILSYTAPMAKKFLGQIKYIIETNERLKNLFPDIFYHNPYRDSPKWTEEAITIKRKTTRKEATIETSGLVEGQKIGMHCDYMKYDDVVVPASVGTPEMIEKTTKAWELSGNLGMKNAPTLKAYCGTRYHYFDTYSVMMDRGIKTTLIPATHNGQIDGNGIYMTREMLDAELKEQGIYTFSAQMLLNPVSDKDKKFRRDWIQYYDELPKSIRLYQIADPANAKKKKSDWTAMGVIGIDSEGNIYLIDAIHDKFSLGERYTKYLGLYDKHRPQICGYEKYGMQADLEFFKIESQRTGRMIPHIFEIGGTLSKEDRILRLVPDMQSGKVFFPRSMNRWCEYDSKMVDLVEMILMELDNFPMGQHDDLIDMVSRIYDLRPMMPPPHKTEEQKTFEEYMRQKEREKKSLDFRRINTYNKRNKKTEWWHK